MQRKYYKFTNWVMITRAIHQYWYPFHLNKPKEDRISKRRKNQTMIRYRLTVKALRLMAKLATRKIV